jgi:hypothetical protein
MANDVRWRWFQPKNLEQNEENAELKAIRSSVRAIAQMKPEEEPRQGKLANEKQDRRLGDVEQ